MCSNLWQHVKSKSKQKYFFTPLCALYLWWASLKTWRAKMDESCYWHILCSYFSIDYDLYFRYYIKRRNKENLFLKLQIQIWNGSLRWTIFVAFSKFIAVYMFKKFKYNIYIYLFISHGQLDKMRKMVTFFCHIAYRYIGINIWVME